MTSFAAPASPSGGVKPADLNGHLLLISPTEYKSGIVTSMGEAEAIECDVVDLDTNEEHVSVLFFNIALRSALKPNIGNQVLARTRQTLTRRLPTLQQRRPAPLSLPRLLLPLPHQKRLTHCRRLAWT
jgi:hypothetical protein